MRVVDNSLRDVVNDDRSSRFPFPGSASRKPQERRGGVMNTDEPREMDMQVATISVRRWTRAWRHHLCQLAVAGLVAGLVLVGLVSTVQAGPHFVLEKVGKNILFNYNNWNFPVGIQLVVNINPPVTSTVDRLVKGGPPPTP
jgi:hypothetical protein